MYKETHIIFLFYCKISLFYLDTNLAIVISIKLEFQFESAHSKVQKEY